MITKTELDIDDCRELICLFIRQACSDYINFTFPRNKMERDALYTAESFLFDDDYYIQWGDKKYNLSDMFDLAAESNETPINVHAFREKIKKKVRQKMASLNSGVPVQISFDFNKIIEESYD